MNFFGLFSADAAYFNSRFLGWLSHCIFKSVVFPVFLKVVQPPTLQHDGKWFLLRLIFIATHLNETLPWADNYLILIIKTDRKKEGKVKYYIECLVCKYKDCLQFSYCFAIIISNNILYFIFEVFLMPIPNSAIFLYLNVKSFFLCFLQFYNHPFISQKHFLF